MENFIPTKEQIKTLLKSEGLYRKVMLEEDECWKLFEIDDEIFTHIIHEVDNSRPYSDRTNFYINDRTCLKISPNPYTNERDFEDLSEKWQQILSE